MSNSTDLIYESRLFRIERHPQPFISREEGGHIRIFPKRASIATISELYPEEAVELIYIEMVVREAMMLALTERGVDMIWVNIEDLGNWAFKRQEQPRLHIHVFGRAKSATKQLWPEAPYLPDRSSGFYDAFIPLNEDDINCIRDHIVDILAKSPYNQLANWQFKND